MQTGVRRVALMSTSFLFQDSIAPFIVGRLFFRRVMTDASEMEGVISESGLDWTIVRPVRLTDARLVLRASRVIACLRHFVLHFKSG